MSHLVAIASTDGKFINEHFGRAKKFLIFEINEGEPFKFLELRDTTPACTPDGHHQDGLEQAAELLKGCRAVLVSQIGPGAAAVLRQKGIEPLVRPNFIEDALVEYAGGEGNKQVNTAI
ncbi:MAG: dinitrogenase iron-molybdenum cofactor biosynthesis protein [Clostridia bacterium]|nr:dinitrogenase iron-molybdenum cofactor biosynthesis protein [Clostridia bacterium]